MENADPAFRGNPTHLQILRDAAQKNDAGVWNRWRDENNVERPDLRGANLSGLILHELNLQFANLAEACLTGASFSSIKSVSQPEPS